MQTESYRQILARVQRMAAIRVESAYRTVAENAVLVITGIMPVDLQAMERYKRHKKEDKLLV